MGNRSVMAVASWCAVAAVACGGASPDGVPSDLSSPEAPEVQGRREIDVLVEQATAQPTLTAEDGFAIDYVVPPGDFYDPLNIRPQDGVVWIDDDGARDGPGGGRIWEVDYAGNVSTLIETSRLTPVLGFDVAPPDFGEFGGEMFLFVQPGIGIAKAFENHLIRHVDPATDDELETLCELPTLEGATEGRSFGFMGIAAPGVAGAGITALFGPAGSPFGDRFFSATGANRSIYQSTADGDCRPFVTFEDMGASGIAFSQDGSKMLVGGARQDATGASTGVIVSIDADGAIDDEPLLTVPGGGVGGLAWAPDDFEPYAGELFFSSGDRLSRLAADGRVHAVASGARMTDIAFVDGELWGVGCGRDYIGGGVYVPDGCAVRVRPVSDDSAPVASAPPRHEREIDRLVAQATAQPTLSAEDGFTIDFLVPPGDLYDPLNIRPQDGVVWIDDDGARDGPGGGRIWEVDYEGNVSTLIETSRLTPVLGFDVAPPDYGEFGGEMFLFVQPGVDIARAFQNHLIRHVDPATDDELETLCELPTLENAGTEGRSFGFMGTAAPGVAGAGITAIFGPAGSPFGDRFFSATLANGSIYQSTADGDCRPFVTFEDVTPGGIAFSQDGSKMLVGGTRVDAAGTATGVVLTLDPDGTVDDEPLVTVPGARVSSLAWAPADFEPYGGELFFASGGTVSRLASDGTIHLVASGVGLTDIKFVNGDLWGVGCGRDYIGGGSYVPDGCVIRIRQRQ